MLQLSRTDGISKIDNVHAIARVQFRISIIMFSASRRVSPVTLCMERRMRTGDADCREEMWRGSVTNTESCSLPQTTLVSCRRASRFTILGKSNTAAMMMCQVIFVLLRVHAPCVPLSGHDCVMCGWNRATACVQLFPSIRHRKKKLLPHIARSTFAPIDFGTTFFAFFWTQSNLPRHRCALTTNAPCNQVPATPSPRTRCAHVFWRGPTPRSSIFVRKASRAD